MGHRFLGKRQMLIGEMLYKYKGELKIVSTEKHITFVKKKPSSEGIQKHPRGWVEFTCPELEIIGDMNSEALLKKVSAIIGTDVPHNLNSVTGSIPIGDYLIDTSRHFVLKVTGKLFNMTTEGRDGKANDKASELISFIRDLELAIARSLNRDPERKTSKEELYSSLYGYCHAIETAIKEQPDPLFFKQLKAINKA